MSIEPVRFQLKRVKGWRKPKGSVIVDRRTIWGNIFVVKGPYPRHEMPFMVYCSEGPGVGSYLGSYKTKKEANQRAVDLFSQYFDNSIAEPGTPLYEFRQLYGWHGFQLASVCHKLLHGKNLVCWCKPDLPCHGDIILKVANPELNLP